MLTFIRFLYLFKSPLLLQLLYDQFITTSCASSDDRYRELTATQHHNLDTMTSFPRMDGCRYIFLGIHARFLYETNMYPDQKYSKLFFDKYFPAIDRIKRRDICVVGFEPNPKHKTRLSRLQSHYKALGLHTFWFFGGVGDENGKKEFVRDKGKENSENQDWGYRAVSPKDKKYGKDVTNTSEVEELVIFRFSEFIREKVLPRIIPDKILDTDPPPAVIAKIDIEHEEYAVMKDLLNNDGELFCALSAISIEYHYYHPEMKKVLNIPMRASRKLFKNVMEVKSLIARAHKHEGCNTQVVEFDSEDYRSDHAEGLKALGA